MSVSRHILALAATALLGWGLYVGWTGGALGPVEWPGAAAVIGGSWLWELRWPLLPAYVAAVLWVAERIGPALAGRR